jgi:hypothetical protein
MNRRDRRSWAKKLGFLDIKDVKLKAEIKVRAAEAGKQLNSEFQQMVENSARNQMAEIEDRRIASLKEAFSPEVFATMMANEEALRIKKEKKNK